MAQTDVTATVAELPEPFAPLTRPFEWVRFANYPNHLAAHIVAGLFEKCDLALP